MTKTIAAILVCLAVILALQLGARQRGVDAQAEVETTSSGDATEYIAREGDSWWKLACLTFRERGLSSQDIQNANPGKKLTPGTVILIPAGKSPVAPRHTTAKADSKSTVRLVRAEQGDTQYSLALQYYADRKQFREIMNANPSLNWAERLEGGEYVLLPCVSASEVVDEAEESATQVIKDGEFETEVTVKVRQRRK